MNHTRQCSPLMLLAVLALTACGGGGGSGGGSPPGPTPPPPPPVGGFKVVSDTQWDATAVKKVLQTFAYGGHASAQQLETWADMPPTAAIREMLTFDEHNLKLSPLAPENTDGLDSRPGTLRGLSDFWMSDDPDNGVQEGFRPLYQYPTLIWYRATLSRGLNPFRQKVGLWETTYHMATNYRVGVSADQQIRVYDDIMNALAAGEPYQDVLAASALSAAVARQYGHFRNQWINGECRCNEDFAREYHQLFFGILGDYDPAYHETVTIKNTAAALTDMRLRYDPAAMNFVDEIVFGRFYHAPGPLEILNASIAGNDARQRIAALSDVAIEHPESLDNLPVIIIAGLGDDNLNAVKIDTIRQAWRSMSSKNLLDFLRGYAISEQFHSPDRIKYLTSIDRLFAISSQVTLSNREVDLEIYIPYDVDAEGVNIFAPQKNVFGDQTGLEAADNGEVFRNNYNRVTESYWRYALPNGDPLGQTWEKDWSRVIPEASGGGWVVRDVAEFLWQRFIADGGDDFGPLEQAHVYALLATNADLVAAVNGRELEDAGLDPADLSLYDFDRVITPEVINSDPLVSDLVQELADTTLPLGSADTDQRRLANLRVGQAVNFLVATPFIFAQEGR